MDYRECKRMEGTHCCAQCGQPLVTKYDNDLQAHYLSCGTDPHHEGFTRLATFEQELARGNMDKRLGPGAQENIEKALVERPTGISLLAIKDLATGDLIPRDKLGDLIDWGLKLALKPYLGHVCLYFGKPYVTIDGYYYLRHKRQADFLTGTRPLNSKECEEYHVQDGDHAWIAEAWRGNTKIPTTGLGIVTKEEIEKPSKKHPSEFAAPVVHDHPQRLAEKRAEWQLYRKLIPLEEEI